MDFDLNWMIYLSQVANGFGIAGALILLACGGASFFRMMPVSMGDGDPFPDLRLRPWVCLAAVLIAVAVLIPSRSTIIYSAALDYGPEYAERLLNVIESDK